VADPISARRHLGVLPQRPNLDLSLRVGVSQPKLEDVFIHLTGSTQRA